MKKLIYKNFFYDVLRFFLLTSLGISIIVWIVQAVNYLDFVSEDGHSFRIYLKYTALNFPKIYNELIIFSYFISVFYIISKYEINNEILIIWSHGIKKISFINTILFLSISIILLKIILSVIIVPNSQDQARSYLRGSQVDFFPQLLKTKQFIDPVKNLTIFVEDKNENGDLKNIFLKDQTIKNNTQIIYSKNGKIVKKNGGYELVLNYGKMINLSKKDSTIINFSKTEFDLSKYSAKTTLFPKIQEIKTRELVECFYEYNLNKIGYKKSFFHCTKNSINAVYQELTKRIVKPFFIIVITFVSLLTIIRSKNEIYHGLFKIIYFFTGLLIIFFSEVFSNFIFFENFLNSFYLLSPILFFILIYMYLFLITKFDLKKL